MRSRLFIPSLAVVLIGVAGCGSSSSSSTGSTSASTSATTTASTPASTGTTTTSAGAKVKKALSRTYAVKMTGAAETPAGAPGGTAKAVVTLSTKTGKVCWTFTSLSGVSTPTYAHIHVGVAGTSGNIVLPLSTGSTLKTKGCVPASDALISQIAANPHGYYVNIHNAQYPGGAVRAQL
jgi:CHRD domain